MNNIIFDVGNVLFTYDYDEIYKHFCKNKEDAAFIVNNIIKSPEIDKYSLIDSGFISFEDAITLIQDRTNHENDKLVEKFLNKYLSLGKVEDCIVKLLKELKRKNYNIYLLSNMSEKAFNHIKVTGLFDLVDGYVLSYREHQVKPNEGIFKMLIKRYNIDVSKTLFIDDLEDNVVTAERLGMKAIKVEADNTSGLIETINKACGENNEESY